MGALGNAQERIGINLDGPYEFQGVQILKGNANSMTVFTDNQFDAVLCNATLEHDAQFWKTVEEIRRVTKPGGLIVIGVPGYKRHNFARWQEAIGRLPIIRRFAAASGWYDLLIRSTPVLHVHAAPGDYYRFSSQAIREVFLNGLDDIAVHEFMTPPRLIGVGRKPQPQVYGSDQ